MFLFYYFLLFTAILFTSLAEDNTFKYQNSDKLNELLNNYYFNGDKQILPTELDLQLLLHKQQHKLFSIDIFPYPPPTDEVIRKQGYPCEVHHIVTEDGYILKVFRIPYGRKGGKKFFKPRPPLLLQHGVMCSSDCWVLSDPSSGLGYRLADEGYDVWISNNRGSTYSMNHTTLSIDDPKFWNYSLHEIGTKDLPAVIDYILYNTGYLRLTYVGHSQGTTIFFIMAASRPEYNNKILVMSALAPTVFLDHMKGLTYMMTYVTGIFEFLINHLGTYHILHHSTLIHILDHLFCRPNSIFLPACEEIFFVIVGSDSPQLNKTLVEVIGDYCPTGASIKQLRHFSQFIKGRFAMYDYGAEGNLEVYNSSVPPSYNLSAVKVPIAIHYSTNDYIATVPEVKQLYWRLPNVIGMFQVPYPDFNHIDFMWAIDVNKLLYNNVIYIIKRFL